MNPGIIFHRNIHPRKIRVLPFKKEGRSAFRALTRPAVNISETTEDYLIVMATPGFRREYFSIETNGSVITISAKKETKQACINDRCEYDYTDWSRAFALPEDADALRTRAEYKNGELTIHIPRGVTGENQVKATIYVY